VDTELAEKLGVRSVTSRADMEATGNDNWVNFANFPALLFPWTSPDGRIMYQARPDNPTVDQKSGKPRKYVFGRGEEPVLWAVREVANPRLVVIIEGTKQCLAGASYAPSDVSVYGIAGCRMWQLDGAPISDLYVADGREVVVILDADAADNPDVYEAGTGLADALAMEGATKVTFGRLPGGASKSGLDDILASRPADRRASYLARVLTGRALTTALLERRRLLGDGVDCGRALPSRRRRSHRHQRAEALYAPVVPRRGVQPIRFQPAEGAPASRRRRADPRVRRQRCRSAPGAGADRSIPGSRGGRPDRASSRARRVGAARVQSGAASR
jgi:hypothetical protein